MKPVCKYLAGYVLVAGTLAASGSAAPQARGQRPPVSGANAACTLWWRAGMARFADGSRAQSFETLADGAKVIVEVLVQSTSAVRGPAAELDTDALLLVTNILKGPRDLQQLAVSPGWSGWRRSERERSEKRNMRAFGNNRGTLQVEIMKENI